MKKSKVVAFIATAAAVISLAAGCGSTPVGNQENTDNTGNTEQGTQSSSTSKEAIRFVNTKIEIDKQLKAFAQQYQEQTGQEVIVESLGGGVDVNGQLKNYLAAGNMPDIYSFAPDAYGSFKDYLLDLSGESWVSDTEFNFTGDDGKTYGFPFAIEGIGLVYNKTVLDQAGIDPATLTNRKAYEEAFKKIDGMKEELGLQAVCSVAAESGQMWWSTGNHIMGAYLAEGVERGDSTNIDLLNEGKLDQTRFGEFADYMRLLFDYADPNVLISGTYDDQLALWAQGKAAFITQGNWIDPSLPDYNVEFECGMAPHAFLEKDTPGILADAPAYWGVYSESDKTDACLAFLEALATTEAGQQCLVIECGMVSPYKSTTIEPATPLAVSMIPYIKADNTYAWDWYYMPEGVSQNATGAVFELYAKNEIDKAGFVSMMETAISDYVSANQ